MSLGRHSIANLIGAVVPMVVAIITVPIYLHYIGPERYGVLAVILALLGYFGFFDLGLGRAVTQRMSRLSESQDIERSNLLWTALTTSFFLGLFGSLVLWISADFLLGHVIKMSDSARGEARHAVFWLLVALPLLLPMSALIGALQARLRYFEVNLIQIIGGVLGQILPLVMAVFGYLELTYLLTATLFARVLSIFLLFNQCRIHIPLRGIPLINRVDLKHMINYGGWVSVMSILAPLLVTVDRLVIGSLSGARAVASYTVPYDLVSRVMVISGSFSSALFPRLASAKEKDGKNLAALASNALVAIMTPVVILGLFLVQPFLQLWVGFDFAASCKWVAEVILIGAWANSIVIPHHARFMAKDNPRTVVFIYIFEIPIYLGMLWLGLVYWGILGAAMAWSVRVFIDTVLLLKLNNVLINTFKNVWASFSLICLAFLGLFLLENLFLLKFVFGFFLMAISIIKEHKLLLNLYRNLRFTGE